MGKSAILAVKIIGDASSVTRALAQVDDSAVRTERMLRAASVAAGLIFAGLLALGAQFTQVASDLEQATGAVDAVFKEYADGVHEYAKTAAEDVGLARDQYSQLASVLGSQLKNLGVPLEDTADRTAELIELGADLSATFGGSAADAVAALSSLLRGERDPIERYGVSIKQADIEARKAQLGLKDLTGEAEKNADLQVTLALLTEQTADSQGRFAAESDTASGAQQRANAAWRDAQAALGEAFLPLVSEGATLLSEFAKWVEENEELVLVLAIALGVITGALVALTAAQWAFNVATLANPVGLVILAIVAAIAIYVAIIMVIIEYWDEMVAAGEIAWREIGNFVDDSAGRVEDFINLIIDAVNWLLKLGSGQFLSDGLGDFLGFESTQYAPQISRVDFASSNNSRTPAPTVNNTTNITVNGAVDKAGTARTIKSVVNAGGRTNGSLTVGGASI